MSDPTADDHPVDEYLDRIRDRFEAASARVLGMTGAATEAAPIEVTEGAFDPQPAPELEVDTKSAEPEGPVQPEADPPASSARHQSHRADPRPRPPSKPLPELSVPRPAAPPLDPQPSQGPTPEAPVTEQLAPVAVKPMTDWRRFVLPLGGVAFVALVAAWALLWFRTDPADAPRSLQSKVEAVLVGERFSDIAARIDGDTVVLVGTVATDDVAAAAADVVSEVDGVGAVDSRVVVLAGGSLGTVAPGSSNVAADVVAALSANGFRELDAVVTDGVATLRGTVRSSELAARAAAIAGDVEGVESIESAMEIVPLRPAVEIAADAAEVLARSPYPHLEVTVVGDTATLTGVADRSAISDGFFRSVASIKSRLLDIEGIGVVRTRLQLKGDEAQLRDELRALIDEQPVVFASARADLQPESLPTLDQAAEIILGQPGLRVFIAGHTDTLGSQDTNEQLSQARGDSVRNYLISVGVPPNRLFVVAYGELFPGQVSTDADRRVEFEVGP